IARSGEERLPSQNSRCPAATITSAGTSKTLPLRKRRSSDETSASTLAQVRGNTGEKRMTKRADFLQIYPELLRQSCPDSSQCNRLFINTAKTSSPELAF